MTATERTLMRDGFAWIRAGASDDVLDACAPSFAREAPSVAREARAGTRIAPTALNGLASLLARGELGLLLRHVLGQGALLVRAIGFDKSAEAPWAVRWHRDGVIPVSRHLPSCELTAPSWKDGVPHVRASDDVLSRMLAVRIHLDDATGANGALEVVPGSHVNGAAPPPPGSPRVVTCTASRGDVLLMRPRLLHRSGKPTSTARRRVLHAELTMAAPLPDGFEWPPHAVAIHA